MWGSYCNKSSGCFTFVSLTWLIIPRTAKKMHNSVSFLEIKYSANILHRYNEKVLKLDLNTYNRSTENSTGRFDMELPWCC